MLILTANIDGDRTGLGMTGKACDYVGALTVRASKIVVDRLSEVEAVAQWIAGDAVVPRIDTFNDSTRVAFAVEHPRVVPELAVERREQRRDAGSVVPGDPRR